LLPANILADELLCGKQQKKRVAKKKKNGSECSNIHSYAVSGSATHHQYLQPPVPNPKAPI